jgi:hypothetical protein
MANLDLQLRTVLFQHLLPLSVDCFLHFFCFQIVESGIQFEPIPQSHAAKLNWGRKHTLRDKFEKRAFGHAQIRRSTFSAQGARWISQTILELGRHLFFSQFEASRQRTHCNTMG